MDGMWALIQVRRRIDMSFDILDRGTAVTTKLGDGYIVKIDTDTYTIPMYHVLLISADYAGEIIYISDPYITPEIRPPTPALSMDELTRIRAELEFSIKRNLTNGVVTCRQCSARYNKIDDTEIVDIESDKPKFYCTRCGERL